MNKLLLKLLSWFGLNYVFCGLGFRCIWDVEGIGPDGKVKWRESRENLVVEAGIHLLLNVMFHGAMPVSPWYVGLKGTGTVADADTLASHAGWAEFTDYTDNRKEFVEGDAASKAISNSGNAASFAINDSGTVAGAFLASVASGTSGTLFSVVDFAVARTVASGDTVNVTYTISAADDGE